jgi:hypothetical protein
VRFRDNAPADVAERDLIAACSSCPVDALTAHDANGRQLAP